MASGTVAKPKRKELNISQTETFSGPEDKNNCRDQAKEALSRIPKPKASNGVTFEEAICSLTQDKVDYIRAYWKPQFTDVSGVIDALQDDPIGTLADLNYGRSLMANGDVRYEITSEMPASIDKAVEKLAANIFRQREKVGKPVSEEESMSMARVALGM